MLTSAEAAKRLGLSRSTVHKMVKIHAISHYKFGKSIRFEEDDIEAFKARCRILPNPGTPREFQFYQEVTQ